MKLISFKSFVLLFFTINAFITHAQKTIPYNLATLLKEDKLSTHPYLQTQALVGMQMGAITTKGAVWLKDVSFKEGTIDVDLRGKNVFLQSFLGIAFHAADTATYDVVYFRPFNFKHADTLRRQWSVQYMSLPDYDYSRLRKEHPLAYENAVTPMPEPDNWFHATIVVKNGWVTVYVNHSITASLTVKLLNDRVDGGIGLWDDGLTGDFANLSITQ